MNIRPESIIQILRETREILLPQWGKIDIAYQKDGSAHNIVTEMDIKVENVVKKKLFKLHSDIGFKSAECQEILAYGSD